MTSSCSNHAIFNRAEAATRWKRTTCRMPKEELKEVQKRKLLILIRWTRDILLVNGLLLIKEKRKCQMQFR